MAVETRRREVEIELASPNVAFAEKLHVGVERELRAASKDVYARAMFDILPVEFRTYVPSPDRPNDRGRPRRRMYLRCARPSAS